MAIAIVLMGVSGCGKTSVGLALSNVLGWPFFDGDDFHPPANIQKMAQGVPLDDADRQPWLESLHDLIAQHLASNTDLIVACSGLKQSYRCLLVYNNPGVVFVYLKGDFDLIYNRLKSRSQHYMRPEMLQSQFDALEDPHEAVVVDIETDIQVIVQEILTKLDLKGK